MGLNDNKQAFYYKVIDSILDVREIRRSSY
jgi:hypothetical protein